MLIVKKSLSEEVAEKLKEQIAAKKYLPGDRLPVEPELMKMFGVGRSSVREAIKLLVNSGLLRVQQGLGTFVEDAHKHKETVDQRLKRAKEQDLDEVRQILELKIAEKAAKHRTSKDLREMRECLERRKKAAEDKSLVECVEADIAFHTAIATASGNSILADLYKAAASHLTQWFLSRYDSTQIFAATYSLHKRLYEAIEAKDPAKAWKLASEIIAR
ncbi:MAG: FadR family transcriptional regulator [Citrobacter freundii]|nr:MAG: FadR family transcriptional regulator [Citrobacter freundii]